MMIRQHLALLRRDASGSVVVEFAIVAPVLIGLLFGVLQFGIGMQNYNALRAISSETARYAVVNAQDAVAQSNLTLRHTNEQIAAYGEQIGSRPPYGLRADRLDVTVTTVTSRVADTSEKTITVTYRVPTMLGVFGMGDIPLTYTRPVFIV